MTTYTPLVTKGNCPLFEHIAKDSGYRRIGTVTPGVDEFDEVRVAWVRKSENFKHLRAETSRQYYQEGLCAQTAQKTLFLAAARNGVSENYVVVDHDTDVGPSVSELGWRVACAGGAKVKGLEAGPFVCCEEGSSSVVLAGGQGQQEGLPWRRRPGGKRGTFPAWSSLRHVPATPTRTSVDTAEKVGGFTLELSQTAAARTLRSLERAFDVKDVTSRMEFSFKVSLCSGPEAKDIVCVSSVRGSFAASLPGALLLAQVGAGKTPVLLSTAKTRDGGAGKPTLYIADKNTVGQIRRQGTFAKKDIVVANSAKNIPALLRAHQVVVVSHTTFKNLPGNTTAGEILSSSLPTKEIPYAEGLKNICEQTVHKERWTTLAQLWEGDLPALRVLTDEPQNLLRLDVKKGEKKAGERKLDYCALFCLCALVTANAKKGGFHICATGTPEDISPFWLARMLCLTEAQIPHASVHFTRARNWVIPGATVRLLGNDLNAYEQGIFKATSGLRFMREIREHVLSGVWPAVGCDAFTEPQKKIKTIFTEAVERLAQTIANVGGKDGLVRLLPGRVRGNIFVGPDDIAVDLGDHRRKGVSLAMPEPHACPRAGLCEECEQFGIYQFPPAARRDFAAVGEAVGHYLPRCLTSAVTKRAALMTMDRRCRIAPCDAGKLVAAQCLNILQLDASSTHVHRAIVEQGLAPQGSVCPVCLCEGGPMIFLPCFHSFCEDCMNMDFRANLIETKRCPVCRTGIGNRADGEMDDDYIARCTRTPQALIAGAFEVEEFRSSKMDALGEFVKLQVAQRKNVVVCAPTTGNTIRKIRKAIDLASPGTTVTDAFGHASARSKAEERFRQACLTGRAAVFVGGTDLAGVNLELAGAICFLSTTTSKGCAEQFAGRVFRKGNPHTEVEVVVFYSKGTEEEGEANKFLGELNTIISSLSSNSPHF